MDGAIDGMVKSLGDPHSMYMKTSLYKSLKEHTAGTFGGIGVTMGFKDDKVTIISAQGQKAFPLKSKAEVAKDIIDELVKLG